MRFWLLLALAAGCGFQVRGGVAGDDAPPDDASADGPAPGDGAIDMPIDTPIPPGDQDGDGVLDPTDNCVASANPDQRNHDADPYGDACDRCPHLPSTTDPDGDGDGVGDACDPRPANNADRRRFWFGFYDASELAGWTAQGAWTIAGGYLVQATLNLTGTAPPGNVNVPYVMTEIVIDNPATNFEIGLSDQVLGTAYECSLVKQGSNVTIRARDAAAGGSGTTNTWTGTSGANSRVQLTLDTGNNIDCRAVQGATEVHPIQNTSGDPTGRTYVGTSGVEARFDYLFVVDREP